MFCSRKSPTFPQFSVCEEDGSQHHQLWHRDEQPGVAIYVTQMSCNQPDPGNGIHEAYTNAELARDCFTYPIL